MDKHGYQGIYLLNFAAKIICFPFLSLLKDEFIYFFIFSILFFLFDFTQTLYATYILKNFDNPELRLQATFFCFPKH